MYGLKAMQYGASPSTSRPNDKDFHAFTMTSSRFKQETKRQRERVEAVTGEWICQASFHRARGVAFVHRGRRLCERCHAEMLERRQQRPKP
jgi:hypothetical protein